MRGFGHCWEMMWCVLRQLNVVCVVHKEEFSLMRASFYFTHHIDSGALSIPIFRITFGSVWYENIEPLIKRRCAKNDGLCAREALSLWLRYILDVAGTAA